MSSNHKNLTPLQGFLSVKCEPRTRGNALPGDNTTSNLRRSCFHALILWPVEKSLN